MKGMSFRKFMEFRVVEFHILKAFLQLSTQPTLVKQDTTFKVTRISANIIRISGEESRWDLGSHRFFLGGKFFKYVSFSFSFHSRYNKDLELQYFCFPCRSILSVDTCHALLASGDYLDVSNLMFIDGIARHSTETDSIRRASKVLPASLILLLLKWTLKNSVLEHYLGPRIPGVAAFLWHCTVLTIGQLYSRLLPEKIVPHFCLKAFSFHLFRFWAGKGLVFRQVSLGSSSPDGYTNKGGRERQEVGGCRMQPEVMKAF